MTTDNTSEKSGLSYKEAGVDIATADSTKVMIKTALSNSSKQVLNTVGAFASLVDMGLNQYKDPVLVMKMEEPGTKQLLAAQHGRLAQVGYDLINHLINDTIMMGAKPLAIQDTIVCGKLEKEIVVALVKAMHEVCRKENCDLVGGETSEQPRVIPNGSYILSACCVGLVERSKIIDGSKIKENDDIIAVSSSGVHTNGYTLIRTLLDKNPDLAHSKVAGSTFLDQVLIPHLCYNTVLQDCFNSLDAINGLAHITGGGIVDNLKRVIPEGFCAEINLSSVKILEIFSAIKKAGSIEDKEMLKTFNLGVGMIAVTSPKTTEGFISKFNSAGMHAYRIGSINTGSEQIRICGNLDFK